MDDAYLKDIIQKSGAAQPDENARKRAINLAVSEFKAARHTHHKENKENVQGYGFFARLTGIGTKNKGTKTMVHKKYFYGGMATAMAAILAVGLTFHHHGGITGQDITSTAKSNTVMSNSEHSTEQVGTLLQHHDIITSQTTTAGTAKTAPRPAALTHDSTAVIAQAAPAIAAESGITGRAVTLNHMAAPAYNGIQRRNIAPMPIIEPMPPSYYQDTYSQDTGRDQFETITENPVQLVTEQPISTFSIDVDTASYSFTRRQINNGVLPQKDAVRIEELINYFDYDYDLPETREQPFKGNVRVVPSPWNNDRKLIHIGIKGYDILPAEKPRSNLVFLIDVSGSMNAPDRLPLLKNSLKMLLDTLDDEDSIAIAVYAGATGTVLDPTKVKDKAKIIAVLDSLSARGSTAGGAGLKLAYQLAEANFDKNAVNRVILATDGDFNVGIRDRKELQDFIERKRDSGIYLSVLGFGQGNYNDHMMQSLAQNGNGTAAYIDNLNEARKVLVEEAGATLFPIANDVKIQVEFNPETVAEYRLIGYETRILTREDFNNDAVDAGDIGAGHTVTALYEITQTGAKPSIDDSRYNISTNNEIQSVNAEKSSDFSNEYAFLKMRYKLPGEDTSRLITTPITTHDEWDSLYDLCTDAALSCDAAALAADTANDDIQFSAAVAAFGQILKGGKYTGSFDYDAVIKLAQQGKGSDEFGYRSEFIQLVRAAKTAAALP